MDPPDDLPSHHRPTIVALRGIGLAMPARALGAILDLISGYTGRRIRAAHHHRLVQDWIRCADDAALRAHSCCEHFVKELRGISVTSGPLECYRGRAVSTVPGADDMGPPIPPKEGRYNRVGMSVLYLCEEEIGVQRELNEARGADSIWVQRFVLRAEDRGIADFTSADPASVIASAFWFAEQTTPGVGRGYGFSQFIGALISERFDGMRVPGVRGTNSIRYTNVVMFSAAERWRAWLDSSCSPTRLAIDVTAA